MVTLKSVLGLKQPSPAPAALVVPEPVHPEWVGWRIASFAASMLVPAQGVKTSSVSLWRAYLGWCRKGKCVPLAMAVFHTRFDALAEEVGIVRFQNGGHVHYHDLDLRKA